MRAFRLLASLLITCAITGQAPAQDSSDGVTKLQIRNVVLGKATEREARKAMKRLADEVIGAAHPTGSNRGMETYAIQNSGPNSLTVTMSLTYYGAFTQKQYSAQATIVVDTTDPEEPEIDKIEVTKGNNLIPPNQKSLAELKSRLNKLLEK